MSNFDIKPGTICTLPNPLLEGRTFEMEALSFEVNGSVQFKFGDRFQWYPTSNIIAVHN